MFHPCSSPVYCVLGLLEGATEIHKREEVAEVVVSKLATSTNAPVDNLSNMFEGRLRMGD
jgi:hypothetical protein